MSKGDFALQEKVFRKDPVQLWLLLQWSWHCGVFTFSVVCMFFSILCKYKTCWIFLKSWFVVAVIFCSSRSVGLLFLSGVRRCEDGCPSTPWSACVSAHSPTLTFSMNGDMPHVPITTLAGIASLTDCEWFPTLFGFTSNLLTMFYLSFFSQCLSFFCHWLFLHVLS